MSHGLDRFDNLEKPIIERKIRHYTQMRDSEDLDISQVNEFNETIEYLEILLKKVE